MRRLTSQELAALYDPWSQPEDAEEEARRRQQQELEEQQHAALLQSLEQQGSGQVRAHGWVCNASPGEAAREVS